MFSGAFEWFRTHRERIGIIAIGHAGKRVEELLFDWLLYGTVVALCTARFGSFGGSLAAFALMTPLSALVCLGYLRFYDWAKRDWLGFETIEKLRESEAAAGWFMRHVIRLTRLGDAPMFFALSIYGDPFMTTVYFRRGAEQYNGLSARDWKIFWGSVFFSNAYWTLRWTVIVVLARMLWEFFKLTLGI